MGTALAPIARTFLSGTCVAQPNGMTFLRFFAIAAIFVLSSVAWAILGASITSRTGEADASLNREVAELWGGVHVQAPPRVRRFHPRHTQTHWVTKDDGTQVEEPVFNDDRHDPPMKLLSSHIDVKLHAEDRKKGLLWFPTYAVDFVAKFTVDESPSEDNTAETEFAFALPSSTAIYDGLELEVDGKSRELSLQSIPYHQPSEWHQPGGDTEPTQVASARIPARPGKRTFELRYRSRGLKSWTYNLDASGGVGMAEDIEVSVHPNFSDFDFPAGSLSPSKIGRDKAGDVLVWDYDKLISGSDIAVTLPARLNPGPIISRITFFAPVSLFFFLVVMTIVGVVRGPSLHPMHYVFLSSSFFSFHLLLAYLVDHIDIHVAFLTASVVSVGLLTSYLRLVAGVKYAVLRAGAAQMLFLVLFGYAFFFEGYAGLIVTIGAIVTLFVLMQITASVDWSEVFSHKKAPPQDVGPYRTAATQPTEAT